MLSFEEFINEAALQDNGLPIKIRQVDTKDIVKRNSMLKSLMEKLGNDVLIVYGENDHISYGTFRSMLKTRTHDIIDEHLLDKKGDLEVSLFTISGVNAFGKANDKYDNELNYGYFVKASYLKDKYKGMIEESADVSESALVVTITGIVFLIGAAALGDVFLQDIGKKGYADMFKEYKENRKVKRIIDKLREDPEVSEFVGVPEDKRPSNWKDIVLSKLNDGEKELIIKVLEGLQKTNEGLVNEKVDGKEFIDACLNVCNRFIESGIDKKQIRQWLGVVKEHMQ